jgi:nitrate/nitrite transporter NarK
MNMLGNLGGSVLPLIIGFCLKRWESWNISLMSVALFYLLAACCWLGIDAGKPIRGAEAR